MVSSRRSDVSRAQAGLTPDVKEYLTYLHAQLDVFVDGYTVEIPGGIGVSANQLRIEGAPNAFENRVGAS